MKQKIQSMDEIFAEEEARLISESRTPERIAQDAATAERRRLKAEDEFRRRVINGEIDENGNPLDANGNIVPYDEDEYEDEDDDDDKTID